MNDVVSFDLNIFTKNASPKTDSNAQGQYIYIAGTDHI